MSKLNGLNRRAFLKGASMTALAGAVGTGSTVSAAAATTPGMINGKYDFDTPYSRIGTDCVKWDSQIALFGDKVKVGMGIADMDFRAAPCIGEAMAERMKHENWGYLSAEAYATFREVIAEWNLDRYNLTVDPNSIVIATGVHPGLIATLKTFSPPGSKVLLMTPTYNGFYSDLTHTQTLRNESEMIFENGRYTVDWDDLEARMTPDTQSMLLCNPQNPTGNVWSEEDLLRIGELCLKHQVTVLADEIHADFVRPGEKYTPFASLPDKEIVDNSVSFKAITKTFSMPASKNAYWFSTNPVMLERIKINHNAGINTLGVVANTAAYKHGKDWIDQLLPYLDANHSYVEDFIKENMPRVGYTKAQGTFLSWLHFDDIMEDLDVVGKSAASQKTDQPMTETQVFESWLVDNSGVQLNDGEGYGKGGERCMRMNIGCSRQVLGTALKSMAAAFRKV
ncbi:MAG: aminotransferase class I/II-fold pyridoxal phosphate-dependent enzyme [Gammaproteobacteria bacterium]|nr:aminotransferase class I/II-fold pyridoxal phosphate-dependent enzyme [Gammaproteobacteria bacterium]